MNPWAFIVIAIGVLMIIMGVKGTQHKVTASLVGHTTGAGTSPTTTGNAGAQPILA